MISKGPFFTLKNKEFRNLLTGRLFMVLAFRMLATLLGWWVYQLTNEAFAIGLIGLSEVVPAVTCALYAGHVIDNREKKRLLLLCCFAYLILIGLLLIPAFGRFDLHLTGHQITYYIYGVIFLTGIARAFIAPMVPTMIPKIVKKENLQNAITMNQATFLTSSVSGHALGGFLIAWIDIQGTLLVILSFIAIATLFFSSVNRQFPERKNEEVKVIDSIKEGITYIYKTKEIMGAMFLDMFAVFFGGAVALIPVFARDILQVDASSYGALNAATDLGAAIVIITLSFVPLKKNQGFILLGVVAGFGMCIIGFGMSKLYWLSFFLLMLSGILDGVSVVIRGTIVQLKTPDYIRGRVMSVNSIFIMSSNELGQFESGLAAKLLGPVKAVIFGGSMTLLIALTVGLTNPKLRKMSY